MITCFQPVFVLMVSLQVVYQSRNLTFKRTTSRKCFLTFKQAVRQLNLCTCGRNSQNRKSTSALSSYHIKTQMRFSSEIAAKLSEMSLAKWNVGRIATFHSGHVKWQSLEKSSRLNFYFTVFYPLSVLSLFSSFIFAFKWFWGRKVGNVSSSTLKNAGVFRCEVGRIFPKLLTDISSWLDHWMHQAEHLIQTVCFCLGNWGKRTQNNYRFMEEEMVFIYFLLHIVHGLSGIKLDLRILQT